MPAAIIIDRVPVLTDVDVLIIGAGSAGCCAAIAAAEGGARTMLVERYGFAGGTSTGVLDTFYGFFTPGAEPRKIVGGIPDRVVDSLASLDAVYLRPNTYGAGTGVTYNPEILKIVWDDLLTSAGVKLLFHSLLVDVEMDAAGRLIGVVLATRGGLARVRSRLFIDASGDAELCHLATIPYERAGDLEPAQTLTTTFRLAGVDFDAFNRAGGKKMLAEKMAAADLARYPLPRRKGSFHAMAIPGSASTVAARVADIDPMNSRDLTGAEILGRKQAQIYERFVRECVPGYANARLSGLATFIGIRETRRVYGEYRLTRDDCMSIRRFDDAVLLCGVPIEDHRMGRDGQDETDWAYVPGNQAYDVPYRTLVPKGREEIWTVGRCFSATHDAHASCRSMAQTMAMGQAAGTAALEQIELLRTLGVDLRHVILSHTDRKPDLAYHRQILSSGVRVEYDSAFRWKPGQPNHTLNLLISLLNEFSKQIMLGMDAARRTYWKQYGGSPGLTFLAGESTHRMRAGGINDDQIRSIFVSTPADAYAFCEGAS